MAEYKQPKSNPNSADIEKRGKELDESRPSIGNIFNISVIILKIIIDYFFNNV